MSVAASAVESGFTARFAAEPEAVFSAPGRVNLIGEHTDYNDGFVLPVAVDRRLYLAVRRREDAVIRAVAGDLDGAESVWPAATSTPIERDTRQAWANYPRGVTEQFRRHSRSVRGMDVYIRSDIPPGAGLSSSAALCAAFALAIDRLGRHGLPMSVLAGWCQAAEHDYLLTRCGIMDPLAALSGLEGHALLIDCRHLDTRPVPLPEEASLVIIESGQSHTHAGGRYNERRAECEAAAAALGLASLRDAVLEQLRSIEARMDARVFRRARHVLTENARVLALVDALAARDFAAVGRLMAASHRSMRDDFEISTPAIDVLVELIAGRLGGMGGARMTGGGFGGSVVALAPAAIAAHIDRSLNDRYARATGHAARIHRCRATGGARQE